MANQKISDFAAVSSLAESDYAPFIVSAANKTATFGVMRASLMSASATFQSTVIISGAMTANSTSRLVGNVSASGTLDVVGTTTLKGNLAVSGTTNLIGNTNIGDVNYSQVVNILGSHIVLDGGGDVERVVISGAVLSGYMHANNNLIVSLATPTSSYDASTKDYVDTPKYRLVTGSSVNVSSTDFGSTIALNFNGAITGTLPDLSSGFPPNKSAIIMFMLESTGSNLTISPSGSGVLLNATGSGYSTGAGCGLLTVATRDGLNWFK